MPLKEEMMNKQHLKKQKIKLKKPEKNIIFQKKLKNLQLNEQLKFKKINLPKIK
jgi:hypothetical protein